MRWLVNLVYFKAALLYLPVLVYQMLFQGKNRRGWRQRFGHWPITPPSLPRIWIHAVSLGEVNATPALVGQLEQRLNRPEIIVSTTTDTGYARACKLYGAERVFRYPLDFSWVVSRVLDRVDPSLIVLVELEVWYHLVRTATRRRIPVMVVNGRLTERSRRRFGRIGRVARAMFGDLVWVGAQDETIARRFVELGVPADRVKVTGSMKWDTTTVADTIEGADALAAALGIDAGPAGPGLWVCGSTGPGEETLILDAYAALVDAGVSLRLAIVPRKPERFDEVGQLISRRGYHCIRRSEHPDAAEGEASQPAASNAVILGDTMGELRRFYSLARAVFVGRSLVPMGGSDPMEAAALGKPIIIGRHTDNFAAPIAALTAADALRVVNSAEELPNAVRELITNPQAASDRGRRAQQVVRDNQGATQRSVERIAWMLAAE
ncbi:MAG: 3-deoxy-D-manno-octulosonic acid transferase [Planctomycetota bacterium]|jgi:3-deoxy-D-manno-octulosonic-acid transferase